MIPVECRCFDYSLACKWIFLRVQDTKEDNDLNNQDVTSIGLNSRGGKSITFQKVFEIMTVIKAFIDHFCTQHFSPFFFLGWKNYGICNNAAISVLMIKDRVKVSGR